MTGHTQHSHFKLARKVSAAIALLLQPSHQAWYLTVRHRGSEKNQESYTSAANFDLKSWFSSTIGTLASTSKKLLAIAPTLRRTCHWQSWPWPFPLTRDFWDGFHVNENSRL